MSKNGKYVTCMAGTPDWPGAQEVSRVICAQEGRGEACRSCPRGSFKLRFPIQIGLQNVACPRWASEREREQKDDPVDYVAVRRDTCLNEKPFLFCSSCPNGKASEVPRTLPKWFEREEHQRRIELALDEEERE